MYNVTSTDSCFVLFKSTPAYTCSPEGVPISMCYGFIAVTPVADRRY